MPVLQGYSRWPPEQILMGFHDICRMVRRNLEHQKYWVQNDETHQSKIQVKGNMLQQLFKHWFPFPRCTDR